MKRDWHTTPRVLIADDEEGIRFVLEKLLKQENCDVEVVNNGEDAVRRVTEGVFDLVVLDMKMPKLDGMEALRRIRELSPDTLVVMITAFGSHKIGAEALVAGAYDYFTKPFEIDELRIVLRRALDKQMLMRRVRSLEARLDENSRLYRLTGRSKPMQDLYRLIQRIGPHAVTVLITGESGVGKELVAEAIHETGGGKRPFIKINCAAIPETLLESELFGHEKGAFTGAVSSKPGKFELAGGGSILLDEIGEMPLSLQAKLLRVIQEKQVERIGDTRSRAVDVRIMTATNRDLSEMVAEKTFREDLYFRINVVPVAVPPLRDRIEDLPLLVESFLTKYASKAQKQIHGVTPEAMRLLESYSWPGNIRELENVIQRAMIMTTGSRIDTESLPPAVRDPASVGGGSAGDGGATSAGGGGAEEDSDEVVALAAHIDKVVEREEVRLILAALRKVNARRQEAADLLGISRKSLHNKMQKYGLFDTKDEEP